MTKLTERAKGLMDQLAADTPDTAEPIVAETTVTLVIEDITVSIRRAARPLRTPKAPPKNPSEA